MITRRFMFVAAAALVLATPARAVEITLFDQALFEQAQADGRPILIHVTAPWCGTCRAQKRVLPELLASPELSGILWLEVDFDTQPDIWQAFGARHQSTMILFRGHEEVARAVGETRPDGLRQLLSGAL